MKKFLKQWGLNMVKGVMYTACLAAAAVGLAEIGHAIAVALGPNLTAAAVMAGLYAAVCAFITIVRYDNTQWPNR